MSDAAPFYRGSEYDDADSARSADASVGSIEVAEHSFRLRIYVDGHAISSHSSKVLSCHDSLLSKYGRSSS